MANLVPDYYLPLTEAPADGSVISHGPSITYNANGANFVAASRSAGSVLRLAHPRPSGALTVALKFKISNLPSTSTWEFNLFNFFTNPPFYSSSARTPLCVLSTGRMVSGGINESSILFPANYGVEITAVARFNFVANTASLHVSGVEEIPPTANIAAIPFETYLEVGALYSETLGVWDSLNGTIKELGVWDSWLDDADALGISDGTITYLPFSQPTITELDPTAGYPGNSFSILTPDSADVTSVSFDGESVVGWSESEPGVISGVTIPAVAAGVYDVTITTAGGTSEPASFTVFEPVPIPVDRTYELDGDIRFFYSDLAYADIATNGFDVKRDPGFETSVLISLFSDARASEDDPIPDRQAGRRGFWGDLLTGETTGSKLWLLGRSKVTSQTLRLAEGYIEEALQWMIDDGIASAIEATATRGGVNEIKFRVVINRVLDSTVGLEWSQNWSAQLDGGM